MKQYLERCSLYRLVTIIIALLLTFSSLVKAGPYTDALSKSKCSLLGYKLPIEEPGCHKTEVLVNSCVGACVSASTPSSELHTFETVTQGCKVTERVNVHVKLKCAADDGSTYEKFIQVRSATHCGCHLCAWCIWSVVAYCCTRGWSFITQQ